MSWRRYIKRAKWDAERRREIESYLDIETAENLARGMPPEAAREAALRKLGNTTRIREEIYHMNTIGLLDSLARDARYALRAMRHNPAFTAIAVLTLALGIGATTATFAVVNGVLIQPLPYPRQDELVGVWHSAVFQGMPMNRFNLSSQMWATYTDYNRTFESFGTWRNHSVTVTGGGDPERVECMSVTAGVLPALAVQPALGRWFSAEDDSPGAPETAILSHAYWLRRFGADPQAIGATATIDGRPRRVIGVMPASFRFLDADPQVILPEQFDRSNMEPSFSYVGLARLKPGTSIEQANADVARMLPLWVEEYNAANRQAIESLRIGPALRPLKEDVVGDVGKVLWVLMGTIGIVLLIACANVANLLLVRAEGRRQEFAIRSALGAGWGRIAREMLVESAVLGLFGGAAGLALAFAGLRLLVAIGPSSLPRLADIRIDPLVLGFAIAASLLSGLLFGAIPALKHAGSRIAATLRGGGRTASRSRDRNRSQNALVVIQVALAMVLLIASGLMIRTFQEVRRVAPGFASPGQVQTARVAIPETGVAEPMQVLRIEREIVDRLAAIPGVRSAAFVTALPMETEPEFENNNFVSVEGVTYAPGEVPPLRRIKWVSPGSFETLGTPLIAGRDFTWEDLFELRDVAVVSEGMARETWGSAQAAVGKRIRPGMGGAWREVVGVVGDVRDNGSHLPSPAITYWPTMMAVQGRSQVSRSVAFAVRSDRAGSDSLVRELREAVWSVNPDLPLARVRTLADFYARSMASTSFALVMLAIAGVMALALGLIGIYGVISYAVSQRRRETGIRLALGAQPATLSAAFVKRAAALAGLGVAIGLAGAAVLSRLLSSLLYGVEALDPPTYAACVVMLGAAAILASYIPARRAARVDPVEALRAE